MNLEDIAKLAGVSRSTVSRVINDDPRVSAAARERVTQIIAETNYRPNAAARSLASRRSRIIGLLIPQSMSDIFRDAWFPVMVQGCMDACQEADLSLTLLMESSTDPATVDRLIERAVRSHHIDGLVISTALTDDVLCPRLMEEAFPFVCIGQDERSGYSFVDIDNRAAARLATDHLIGHGYRTIGLLAGHEDIIAARSRHQGYLDALQVAGIPVGPIRWGEFNEHRAYDEALAMLSGPDRPEAIFATSDAMAVGVLRAAQSLGLRVPGDLAVMGFDGFEDDLLESHRLSTVRQPARAIGRGAVELLIDLIANPERAPNHITYPVSLHLGATCGAGHITLSTATPPLSTIGATGSGVAQ
ncbi:MAG: LacI family DNA-binding transcriptional regulator [Thermomicrobiales bacterium]